MQVGNDIVDLNHIHNHNPRFAARVLALEELQAFEARDNDPRFLWQAWAAKESAFKVIKQLGINAPFSPAKFIWKPDEQSVCYEDQTIPVLTEVSPQYVYCFSKMNDRKPLSTIAPVSQILRDNPIVSESMKIDGAESGSSLAVRVLARRIIAEHLHVHPLDIRFKKNEFGVPQAYYQERLLEIGLSFSHHGDYAAVATTGSFF